MMTVLLALALIQGPVTVGDTVWIRREVAVPPGRTVRPADWEPEDPVELLGPARVIVRGGSAEIAYPVVVWVTGEHILRPPGPLLLGADGTAGEHILRPPGPLLLGADGTVDSLPTVPMTLRVTSVLPKVPPDSTLKPQPRAEFVARGATTLIPLLILLVLALLLLAPLHWWWRRRGKAQPLAPTEAGGPARLPLERWADAGESRAVSAAATSRLRSVLAARVPAVHPGLDTEAAILELRSARPDWPLDELGDLLRSLDEARFGHVPFPDAIGLARWAGELEPRLLQEAAA